MSEEKEVFFMDSNNSTALKSNIRIFKNTKVLVIAGLLAALSIVLGKFTAINIGNSIRIGFGALPIQMAGIFFGPVIGAVVGGAADLIGCILRGYAINPIITLGSISIGFVSGAMYNVILKKLTSQKVLNVALSTLTAHIIGSMIITSYGLFAYYHTPMQTLAWRVPIYLITSAVETIIISIMLSNKGFSAELEKVTGK